MLGGFVKKIIWKRRLARAGDRGTDLGQKVGFGAYSRDRDVPKDTGDGET